METLSDKIFKNKMIMEGDGYFFLSVEDVKKFINDLKDEFRLMDTADFVLGYIDKLAGDELL